MNNITMKCILFILSSFFTTCIGKDVYEKQRFVMISDDSGQLQFVDLDETEQNDDDFDPANVEFHLFTRNNNFLSQVLVSGNDSTLYDSNFDGNKQTKVIIHGWRSSVRARINNIFAEAFLSHGDYNIICVDWTAGSSGLYMSSSANVLASGLAVANFLSWLIVKTNLNGEKVHILGHSLGAHVAGVAGRHTSSSVAYITGMDPAQPRWYSNQHRLSNYDAKYVEVIHTDTDVMGLEEPIGDTDFYPNGGLNMPGCRWAISCSHTRSYEYIAESINNDNFWASRCVDIGEINECSCHKGNRLKMGGVHSKFGNKGVYYLKTSHRSPFALG